MAAAAAIVGGALTLTGAANKAKAEKVQGAYQNSMLQANATFADMQSQDALRRGDKEASSLEKKGKSLIGSQRAAFAAQGIQVDTGSALDVQLDTAEQVRLDALTIKNNAWRESWGYEVQASNLRYQGKFAQLGANTAASNTLLTGGLQAANYGAQAYSARK